MFRILFKLTRKNNFNKILCNMSTFTQYRNPLTGNNEWVLQDDDYDYHQEVANTGFGDMLHDTERNQKYFAALRKTIAKMHNEGREVHVLDIGTGTGILSMMAVVAGADTVVACEAFTPMANCAEKIFHANQMDKKVKLIKKRSTEIKVGIDMPRKANLLVAELLDTELIGEGALGIYNHAHKHLLTDDVICIPAKANCYAQVAQTTNPLLKNKMPILANLDADKLLRPPAATLSCKGSASLHDLQLSQLPQHTFTPLTKPIEIFQFDFNSKTIRPHSRVNNLLVETINSGSTDVVFYWWNIEMDLDADILLSCAPYWVHPDLETIKQNVNNRVSLKDAVPWRDHWMQAVYYIPKPIFISAMDKFNLICNHDEYSLWFDAASQAQTPNDIVPRHNCSCSFHSSFPYNRIGQYNDFTRNKRYLCYLESAIDKDSNVLSIGDGCLLGLFTKLLGANNVICYEHSRNTRRFVELVSAHNDLSNVQFVDDIKAIDDIKLSKITHVFAEPYFTSSILPWDNFYFGIVLEEIRDKLNENVNISPQTARVYAVPVEFLNLHKIRAPVVKCEGFDLRHFDEMVQISTEIAQAKIEAQPLWEYPCIALSKPEEVLEVDFNNYLVDKATSGTFKAEASGSCNGIALWVNWHPSNSTKSNHIVSMGPVDNVQPGEFINWYNYARQAVHLIPTPKDIENGHSTIEWTANFKPKLGSLNFTFNINV
ncbi:protein arginine N-methyltransferase 7-like [Teleopsis dalmanni]|uniref:protein arginine N-methyltransferase 7-like n=1 Tax=Teleopsis dalmanni TaxID=139649 RepID=UPI0018CEF3F3|nr:protein arginine N-methyltransferase 7-like [Teleopsis dalmanni]